LLVGEIVSGDFDLHQIAETIDERVPFAAPNFFFPYRCPSQDHERR
jgi:hypothetical protein